MSFVSIAALAVLSASRVWTEPSLVNVFPDSEPGPGAAAEVRLYAARGELESFQLCIRGGRNGMSGVTVHTESPHDSIEQPAIHRVGYLSTATPSERAVSGVTMHPDPLIPFEGAHVEPDETLVLWVTYAIGPDTPAGIHRGTITVSQDRGRSIPVDVTIEVFDFTLPRQPTLRSMAPLDRDTLRAFYSIDRDALDAWAPYYDAFATSRLSLSLWHGYGLVHLDEQGRATTEPFKEHLEYAVGRLAMNAINIANGAFGLDPFPHAAADDPDPLQPYLHDMGDWLDERGWLDRALLLPISMPPRAYWPAARDLYQRIHEADPRFSRLLAGAPHPYFETHADIWAVPLRHYHPHSVGRLQQGMSLSVELPFSAHAVRASSSGPLDETASYVTEPGDAYDGSLFTAWCSADAPSLDRPQWIELQFDEPVDTRTLTIGWEPGYEADAIRVFVAPYGTRLTSASTSWEHRLPQWRQDRSWSVGQFRTPWRFDAIRFEFLNTRRGGPVAVRQIEFGREPEPDTLAAIEPVETWLCPLGGDFPSLAADVHPAESRLLGWVCWGHDMEGFTLPGLVRWPARWRSHIQQPPLIWSDGGTGEDFLFYPGPDGPMPSIRSMRLRDGLEDYEYLRLMAETLETGDASPDAHDWIERRTFAYDLPPERLDAYVYRLLALRRHIGREHAPPPLLPWQRRQAP